MTTGRKIMTAEDRVPGWSGGALLRPVTHLRSPVDPAGCPNGHSAVPEHPSEHSVHPGAASPSADLFGDRYLHRPHPRRPRAAARSFRSFSDAAQEAAISRLYGGIHFRPAIELGLAQGNQIGQAASRLSLRR